MSKPFIVVGDKTSHGGTVVSGCTTATTHNKLIARVGDKVTCPQCGSNTIATGDDTMIVMGHPVARHGDKTACGATLISSQSVTVVDYGGGNTAGRTASFADMFYANDASDSTESPTQRAAAMMRSPSSFPAMVASNGDDDPVVKDEARNAADAFSDAYAELVDRGVIGSGAASLLSEAGARALGAGNQAYDLGSLSAGLSQVTFVDARADLNFYVEDGERGPTGRYYPGSLVNWGRVDWRAFDRELDNSPDQIWANFLKGAGEYAEGDGQ